MTDTELQLADGMISHQIDLFRYTAGERGKVLTLLRQMEAELKANFLLNLTDFGRERVTRVLAQTTGTIDTYYQRILDGQDFNGLSLSEAGATTSQMIKIGLEASLPTKQVLSALVSDMLLQGAPLSSWWERQAQDTAFKFTAQVQQGVAQGETMQQIIRRVFGSPRLGLPGIMEVTRKNASTLVHDAVMKVANDSKMAVYESNDDIISGYRQLSTLDSHTSRTCIAYAGATWDKDKKPTGATTLPFNSGCPRHPNCLPGDTIISAAGISKHYKRWFEGEVVVLSITGIDDVTITPNHPVLTDYGWVAAGELKKGENLVFCDDTDLLVALLNPSDHHVQTSIEEVGHSLLVAGGMFSGRVPTTPEDFHGDGTIDKEVDIILANSLLGRNRETTFDEQIEEDSLAPRHRGRIILNPDSAIAKLLKGGRTTSTGFLGSKRTGGTSSETGAGCLNPVCLANRPEGELHPFEAAPDDTVTDPCGTGNITSRLTSLVRFVKLQNITVRKYASHVYNLQSDLGWYVVNIAQPQSKSKGIIVHNCRSLIMPITKTYRQLGLDIPEKEPGTRSSDLGQVKADTTFSAFLKRHPPEYADKLLGPGRAELWRSGRLTLSDLVNGQGRELTIEQLRRNV